MTIEPTQLHLWSAELSAIAEQGAAWAVDRPYDQWRFQRTRRVAEGLAALSGGDDPGLQTRPWGHILISIANEGQYWTDGDAAALELYRRVRRVAAELLAAQGVGPLERIERSSEMPAPQSPPYTGSEAAVFDAQERLLLIRRRDNGLWALPGGAMEVGESPSAAACREGWEETGIESDPQALVGVYDVVGSRSRMQILIFVFLCRARDAAAVPVVTPETMDVGWFAENELPSLSSGHAARIGDVFRFRSGRLAQPVWS